MTSKGISNRHSGSDNAPRRAVIDIGSNTVRMVVYSGPNRAPQVWLNEKVTAKLGRDLASTGRMPEKAIDLALGGLARFALILPDIGVKDVDTVATAAVRDAENGPEFLARVRGLGLDPRLLSGEEEANTAAFGVIGAFPGSEGVVADLGGGSLELVAIGQGQCHDGLSLPLGTLRLPALREAGDAAFDEAVAKELKGADWAREQPGPLYMVGGTWRAFANYSMHRSKYPLTDPQAYCLSDEEADKVAKKLSRMNPEELSSISGISSSRASGLPDAAAMLRTILDELKPAGLVFSSWGLREGLLFQRLNQTAREQDPLLSAVTHFTVPRGASPNTAAMIAGWTSGIAKGNGRSSERLRLAATMLAMAQLRIEPNMRLKHSFDWAMDKRWVGLDHEGRALLGAALRGSCGKPEPTPDLLHLADESRLRDAASWGLAYRLCRRLGAGSRASVLTSNLDRQNDRLVLWVEESRADLVSDSVVSDLDKLAQWLGCTSEVRIGKEKETAP